MYRYRKNVKRVSAIFKANPQTPLERAVFWIEHVLKFGGDYLRSSRTDLYFWQVYAIDVYVFLLVIIYLIYRVIKLLFVRGYHRRLCGCLCQCLRFPLRRICPRLHLNMSGNMLFPRVNHVNGGLGKGWTGNGIRKVWWQINYQFYHSVYHVLNTTWFQKAPAYINPERVFNLGNDYDYD